MAGEEAAAEFQLELPEGSSIEWTIAPEWRNPFIEPILTTLTEFGIPEADWSDFETAVKAPENESLCRNLYSSVIFLEAGHRHDATVFVHREGHLLGVIAMNYVSDGVALNQTELYINQICVAPEAKGLGSQLLIVADAVAASLGLSSIRLISGTTAQDPKGASGKPKLLQWYLNHGYNWVNQGRRGFFYPTLIKPLTPAAIAEHAIRVEEGRVVREAREAARAAAEAAFQTELAAAAAAAPAGGVPGTPPPEEARRRRMRRRTRRSRRSRRGTRRV